MMQRIFSMEEFINISALKRGVYQTMVIYINENNKSYLVNEVAVTKTFKSESDKKTFFIS